MLEVRELQFPRDRRIGGAESFKITRWQLRANQAPRLARGRRYIGAMTFAIARRHAGEQVDELGRGLPLDLAELRRQRIMLNFHRLVFVLPLRKVLVCHDFLISLPQPTLQLPADNHQTVSVYPVNLKNRFGDVETNGRNRLHGKLLQIVGALNSPHIFGTLVPVEEPSTAS